MYVDIKTERWSVVKKNCIFFLLLRKRHLANNLITLLSGKKEKWEPCGCEYARLRKVFSLLINFA